MVPSIREHSSSLLLLELTATFDTTDGSILFTTPVLFVCLFFASGILPPLTLLAYPFPEFFILSLNFEFACFYFLPFSFSSLFLDNPSPIHPCFSLQPPKLFAFSFVLSLGAKTPLPTLVSRLAHTGPERLRSRKYVILNGLEAISVQQ